MIFKNFTLNQFKILTINFYFCLSLFLIIISFKYVQDWSVQIYYLVYLLLTSILLKEKKFNNNNLSLLLNFYTTFFLTIPLSYIVFNPSYIFGSGSLLLPFKQIEYRQSLDIVILKIIFFWVSIWLSIFLTAKKNYEKEFVSKNQIIYININILFLIAIIGVIISVLINYNFIDSLQNNKTPEKSFLRFLFSDHAIIIYSSILFIYYKNLNKNMKFNNLELKYFTFVFIYFLNFLFLGSKGGILILYLLSFLFILSSFKNSKKINIFFLRSHGIILLIFTTLITYLIIDIFRADYYLLKTISFSDLTQIFQKVFFDIYYSGIIGLEKILIRLTNQGMDQFILINLTFSEYDFEYAKQFSLYIYKNFINLMLPGTIYLEAYSPSSQLFTEILFKSNLNGEIEELELIKKLNTQPFTAFGFFTILFGSYLSLIMSFIYFFFLSLLINKTHDVFFRVVVVGLFYLSFVTFAFEEVVASQIQLYFQILFIHFFALTLNQLLKKYLLSIKII
jgi:hypothetical protein